MKKKYFCVIFGFFAGLLLFSCSIEENLSLSPTNQETEKVRIWFENNSNSLNLKIIEYTKEIQWDKAIITNGEKGQIIEIPITLQDFIETTSSTDKKQKNYHRLLFTKNENETYNCFDLQIITSEANFDKLDQNFNYYNIRDDFNGYVTLYDPIEQKADYQKFKDGKISKPSITGRSDADTQLTCTYLVWIYEDGHVEIITRLYCEAGGVTGGGSEGGIGGYGGAAGSTTPEASPFSALNPCDKIKLLKQDPNYINALAKLKGNFKLHYETGYYISESNGYEAGTSVGNFQLKGNIHADTYGIIHVHEDNFTHQVSNQGNLRNEEVTPIHMFSPGDVNRFSTLLMNANNHQTPLDKVFIEMVSSSGRYQLRFEGNITNVKNFDYESLDIDYMRQMDFYSNDLETGLLMFIKDYIGIDGITLFKMNDDGSTERKTLSSPNVLSTNPC